MCTYWSNLNGIMLDICLHNFLLIRQHHEGSISMLDRILYIITHGCFASYPNCDVNFIYVRIAGGSVDVMVAMTTTRGYI